MKNNKMVSAFLFSCDFIFYHFNNWLAKKRSFRFVLGTFILLSSWTTMLRAQAPNIVRGPYLNSVTSTSAVIRWRTEQSTDSKVSFSTDISKVENQTGVT